MQETTPSSGKELASMRTRLVWSFITSPVASLVEARFTLRHVPLSRTVTFVGDVKLFCNE